MPSTKTYKINLWDVPGSETIDLSAGYMQECNGTILMYDITNQETFSRLEERIIDIERLYNAKWKRLGKIIVGNKVDLESERTVPSHKGQMYADKLRIPFLEVSALEKTNIDMLFKQLLNEINRKNERYSTWWKKK